MHQLFLLLLGQLSEPIVASVLYPFINQLISEVGVTGGDDRKIGYYAGFIESLFFFAEFTMVLRWGRLSDRIGRKPVILYGLTGMMISSFCFGLSKSYIALVISRALNGALSGNIGVMKSAICEVTDETSMAEGFALLPVVWSVGGTIGPLLGGFLSKPQEKFPAVFSAQFWQDYPYFLPCACAGLICLFTIIMLAVYLEESLPSLKKNKEKHFEYKQHVRLDSLSPTDEPLLSSSQPDDEDTLVELPPPKQYTIWEILTPGVTVAVSNYATLSLLDIARAALIPLFYATPIEAGGLGFKPSTIGVLLGVYGLLNGVMQTLFAARAQRRFGTKTVYVTALLSYFGNFTLLPLMNMAARAKGTESNPLLWCILFLQLVLSVGGDAGFGCVFMFITSAAEKSQLGATNGIAQSVGSLMRTIGPASATSLFAWTMENGLLGGNLVYAIFITLTAASLMVAIPLPSRVIRTI
ncbi:hypothetical protein FRB95_001699 [Tulasnella sp. JGI-2019a]|nr:hypothetical protein FRB95_001699 [Tulasnella sp. JGI-2019a]